MEGALNATQFLEERNGIGSELFVNPSVCAAVKRWCADLDSVSVMQSKCIDLCSCGRCESMVGDNDNDKEIDKQGASDHDYDSETGGSEYTSGVSDYEENMIKEGDLEGLY